MKQNRAIQANSLIAELLRLRYWQLILNEELKKKTFKIPVHVAMGHEAIAVAVSHAMTSSDQLVLSHRNMVYNLVRLGSLKPIYDEYKLSPGGIAEGKLGSMNLANPHHGVAYSSSILGNNVSIACGLALGNQMLARDGILIVLLGDGAIEEGPFYEGLIFAKSHRLKVLFLVENNNYSMASTIQERRCPIALKSLCEAVDISYKQLFGDDVVQYLEILTELRRTVDQSEPACIEVHLVTHNQHAGPTPGWPTDPKKISIENGLVIEQTVHDPVFVVQESLSAGQFQELSAQILSEKWEI